MRRIFLQTAAIFCVLMAAIASSAQTQPQIRGTETGLIGGGRMGNIQGGFSSGTGTSTIPARLFRDGGPGDTCDNRRPVPTQANVTGTFSSHFSLYQSLYDGCTTAKLTGHGSGRVAITVHGPGANQADPKLGLLAYSHDWVSQGQSTFVSFRVPVGQAFTLRVYTVDDNDAHYTLVMGNSVARSSDFDGDGFTDSAVFRPSTGAWYILRSSDNTVAVDFFGSNGDVPLDGDFDGDGKTDLGIFRPSNGTWYYKRSSNNSVFGAFFGLGTDKPVPGDYDKDGITDIGAFRDGNWLLSPSGGAAPSHTTVTGYPFGSAGDIPVGSQRK